MLVNLDAHERTAVATAIGILHDVIDVAPGALGLVGGASFAVTAAAVSFIAANSEEDTQQSWDTFRLAVKTFDETMVAFLNHSEMGGAPNED